MNASITLKPENVLGAPQCGHVTLQISMDASSISRVPARSRNRIDDRTTRVANEVGHIATFLDHEAAVAIRASGEFVRDDQVAAFVLGHIGVSRPRARNLFQGLKRSW